MTLETGPTVPGRSRLSATVYGVSSTTLTGVDLPSPPRTGDRPQRKGREFLTSETNVFTSDEGVSEGSQATMVYLPSLKTS